jgi:hypothetical protein
MWEVRVDAETQAERLNHALYGLIIVTATLVAEREHVDSAGGAIALLLGTALVLLLAHTYSAAMAARAVDGHALGTAGRRLVALNNIPVLLAIAVPVLLFVLTGLEVISLTTAYRLSIATSLAALFGLGVYEGREASMTWPKAVLSGIAAGAIGILVIGVEALFD